MRQEGVPWGLLQGHLPPALDREDRQEILEEIIKQQATALIDVFLPVHT